MMKLEAGNVSVVKNESGTEIRVKPRALLVDLTDEEVVALRDLLGQHPAVVARRESSFEFVPPEPLAKPLPPSFMLLFSASSKHADVIEFRFRAPDGRLLARGESRPKEPMARIVAYPYDLERLQPFRSLFMGLFLELERLK